MTFEQIKQEINANLPDNLAQLITAKKLRDTMIDLTDTIEDEQEVYEATTTQTVDDMLADLTAEVQATEAELRQTVDDMLADVEQTARDAAEEVLEGAVKVTPQNLTDAQKQVANENIGLGVLVTKKTSFQSGEITNGKYIYSTDGTTGHIDTNASFSYTKPFYVCKGSNIKIKCAGYTTRLTVISKKDGDNYFPLVQSIDSNVQEYTYNVPDNMYICFSFNTASFDNLIITNDISQGIESLGEDVKEAKETAENSVQNPTKTIDFSDAVQGTVIRADGSIAVNQMFSALRNLDLHTNDVLTITAKGWVSGANALAMISRQQGANYICLVPAIDSNVQTYTYTATGPITVALCYNNTVDPIITVKSDLSALIEEMIESENDQDTDVFTPLGNLFPTLGIIGDSLSSGQTENPNSTISFGDIYGSSWLSCLARGWNCVSRQHYSTAGITCKNWLEGSGLPQAANLRSKFESDPAWSAYFLALGTNDCSKRPYNLGNITDAAGANTFVGQYKQIIELIRTHAPNTVIFCVSLYTTNYQTINYNDYSAMIAQIADLYDNTFFIDFIGNTEHKNNDNDGTYSIKSHFCTMGYQYVSKVICKLVNDVVKNNASFFATYGVYNSQGGQYTV